MSRMDDSVRAPPVAGDQATGIAMLKTFGCVLLRQVIHPQNIESLGLIVASLMYELNSLPVEQQPTQFQSYSILAIEELNESDGLVGYLCSELKRLIPSIVSSSCVNGVLGEVFGAPPVVEPRTIRARRHTPERGGTSVPWHQDLSFLGHDSLLVNCWIPLTECGLEAPALDLVPSLTRQILPVKPPTDSSEYEMYGISQQEIETIYGENAIWTPSLSLGDCLLFDNWCVHRTSLLSSNREFRDSVEIRFSA